MRVDGGVLMLGDVAVVRARGSAARAFLGRQLTCDVARLAPGAPLLGAWLTAKGRVLCLVRLVDPGDGSVLLLVADALCERVMRRMRMFVLRDDVHLERAPEIVVAGLAGPAVEQVRSRIGSGGMPAVVPLGGAAPPLALLMAPADTLASLIEGLTTSLLDHEAWRALQIRAGLPDVTEATGEAFVPQMLNLDRLGAVSFTKGCYPGQEIVARTQHLGRIKRRMFVARCGATADAQPGQPVSVDGDMHAPGHVVLTADDGAARLALVVLPLDAVAAGREFRLGGPAGPVLEISPPPYSLDDAGSV